MTATPYKIAGKRVFVAGHKGMVGSAIVRRLARENCTILTADRTELDLSNAESTARWFNAARPDAVVLAAARVGGIRANSSYPVDFLCENLAVELSVIRASHAFNVEKLLFLGSSCIYPRLAKQPISEDELLTGPLEPTNEWYAIAKIAGVKMCQAFRRQFGDDFISVMPTNLFGPGDNYHPDHSHVPAALLRRFHEATRANAPAVSVWGTGRPLREFLYVDDLADACVFLLQHYSDDRPINVGTGTDVSIADFAALIASTVGYQGQITFDTSKPDGTPRKLLDISRLSALGWRAQTPLAAGLSLTYENFLNGHGRHVAADNITAN
jgi:GDP-L-fucose synthase